MIARKANGLHFALDTITKEVKRAVVEYQMARVNLGMMRSCLPADVYDVANDALGVTEPEMKRALGEKTRDLLGPQTLLAISKVLTYVASPLLCFVFTKTTNLSPSRPNAFFLFLKTCDLTTLVQILWTH